MSNSISIKKTIVIKDDVNDPLSSNSYMGYGGMNFTNYKESKPHVKIHAYHNVMEATANSDKSIWFKYGNIPMPVEHNTDVLDSNFEVGVYIIRTFSIYEHNILKASAIINYIERYSKLTDEVKKELISVIEKAMERINGPLIGAELSIRVISFIPVEMLYRENIIKCTDVTIYSNTDALKNEIYITDIGNSKDILNIEIEATTTSGILEFNLNGILVKTNINKSDTNNIVANIKKNGIIIETIAFNDKDAILFNPPVITKEMINVLEKFRKKHDLDSDILNKLVNNKIESMKQLTKIEEIIAKEETRDVENMINTIKMLKTIIK